MRPLCVKAAKGIAILWLSLGACSAALAESSDTAASGNHDAALFVEAFRRWQEASAEADFLRGEGQRSDIHQQVLHFAEVLGRLDDGEIGRAVAEILSRNYQPLQSSLERAADDGRGNRQRLEALWLAVRGSLDDKRTELYEERSNERIVGQLAFLMSIDNRWFWLFGLLAVATLAATVLHERRHEIRRRLNGGRSRAMGLATILQAMLLLTALTTVAVFFAGDRIYRSLLTVGGGGLSSPHDRVEAENKAIEEKRAHAEAVAAEAKRRPAVSRETGQTEAGGRRLSPLAGQVLSWHESIRHRVGQVSTGLEVQNAVAGQLKTDAAELQRVQKDLSECSRQLGNGFRKRRWISFGLGIGLLAVVATVGGAFQINVRRRREKVRNTCPQCLGEGTFQPMARQSSGGESIDAMLRCTSLLCDEPYREECEFMLPQSYLEMPKLCLPTLGIPAAGKTHWLAMTYRELKRNNYRGKIQFSKVRSPAADEFDQKIDEILNLRLNMEPTPEEKIPRPLVFNFDDRDPLGRSSILVNIFDYSGEVMRRQTLDDRQRRRALDGDGFLFFLDPTSSGESQASVLQNFRNDLCRVKRVKPNAHLRIPVALCVSKLDLMVNQSYSEDGAGGAVDDFYRGLTKVGWASTLSAIEARGRLVARLRETIWPGWPIERTLHSLFGGRCMFFPLTPVGLDGLGIEDLRERVIAPLGLLDPLLWLLHMNGYRVLH